MLRPDPSRVEARLLSYRILTALAALPLLALLAVRVLSGRESAEDIGERLGGGPAPEGPAPIWLHGASNGELTSARMLIRRLQDRAPDVPLVVTTNTTTGRALVRDWALPGAVVQLAPVDSRAALKRFLTRTRPGLYLGLENEIWPNRFDLLAGPGIPATLVGARMSARSARRWARLPGLARAVFPTLALVSPQDTRSGAAFETLGVKRLGQVVNLKAAVAPAAPVPDVPAFAHADTILAAATHEGEDAPILAAFAAAHAARPALRLILAPRHPRRAAEIETLATAAGLGHVRRSAGGAPDAAHPVYIADTFGEMSAWYEAASVTFVCGSLVDRGGHTPFEPAHYGSAILHGPHVSNHADAYARLTEAGAARAPAPPEALAEAFLTLPGSAAAADMARRAETALAAPSDAVLEALVDDLLTLYRGVRD